MKTLEHNDAHIPELLIAAIDKGVQDNTETGFRTHLGASVVGNPCARAVWYHFRWTAKAQFSSRLLRLFQRGHDEEDRFEKMMKDAGIQVHMHDPNTKKQFQISDFGGHFGGSTDGACVDIPDLPNVWLLDEFKTHNDKSFKKLYGFSAKDGGYDLKRGEGVRKSKPQHFAQMQVYMGYTGLTCALYCAVNKNDDKLYFEVIAFDQAVFDRYRMRAFNAIHSREPLERIANSPSWFECKWCDYCDVCHRGELPLRNCRTCAHVIIDTEGSDGAWRCKKSGNKILTKQEQEEGCGIYKPNKQFKK